MSWPKKIKDSIGDMDFVINNIKPMFVDREQVIDLMLLATICQENILLVGPPGTAKTELINQYTKSLELKRFCYLLTRFTEPSEVFGPLDLKNFQDGKYSIKTDGMLPDAKIAFLDEVFQGSSAILNSLLTVLNERIFYNGNEIQRVPLITLIGATNSIPDDPSLKAFADRFVLRYELNTVEDDRIDDLLEIGWDLEVDKLKNCINSLESNNGTTTITQFSEGDIVRLQNCLHEVDISQIKNDYSMLIRELRAEGINLSDRRIVKGLKLIAGAALIRDSDIAEIVDFWPIAYLWDKQEENDVIASVIEPKLSEAGIKLFDFSRDKEDIEMDFERLKAQSINIKSETAIAKYLTDLNKLRRELINNYPKEKELLKSITISIKEIMERMEAYYVQS